MPEKKHLKVFPGVPIEGFLNRKSLKDHLERASLPILSNTLGSEPRGKETTRSANLL